MEGREGRHVSTQGSRPQDHGVVRDADGDRVLMKNNIRRHVSTTQSGGGICIPLRLVGVRMPCDGTKNDGVVEYVGSPR